jgi:hypothetical protein
VSPSIEACDMNNKIAAISLTSTFYKTFASSLRRIAHFLLCRHRSKHLVYSLRNSNYSVTTFRGLQPFSHRRALLWASLASWHCHPSGQARPSSGSFHIPPR